MAASWAVIVPTYNRAERLPRLVAALEAQRGAPDFELVIVDDASQDESLLVAHRLAGRAPFDVTVRSTARNWGPAGARDVGWRMTPAPWIAFLDDDCVPSAGWLAALERASTLFDIVQGRTAPDPEQLDRLGPFSRTVVVSGLTGFFETCNIAYRRAVLESVDGFDKRLRYAGEDTDLGLRATAAGATIGYAADAAVHHDVRPSSWRATIRDSWRWHTIPATVARHPELRSRLYHRWFWKPAHARSGLLVVAVVTGATLRRRQQSRLGATVGVLGAAPYLRQRLAADPLPGTTTLDRLRLVPSALVADLVEVAVCLVGSVEARTLVV